MAKNNKYDYRLLQENSSWTAEITRRATSKNIIVSKRQNGFKTETDAQTWGQAELKTFLENLKSRNKRRSKKS